MFPGTLAEELFSLTNKQDQQHGAPAAAAITSRSRGSCCAVSVGVQLDEDGGLASWEVTPSVISIDGRLTYDDADEDLALGPGSCKYAELQLLYEAARTRKAWRVSRGCIDIDLPEAKLEVPLQDLDSSEPRIKIQKISQWESAARMTVAEMMILAGEAVGALGVAEGLPLPYRGQGAPQLPNSEVLEALPEGPCKGYALRKCMTRSSIEPEPQRHASLALDAYVQFTSPIRRYTDMMAHWNVKAWLRGQPPPFSAADISSIGAAGAEVGRDLGRAEGEVGKYWTAEYLRQHHKEEWAATVLGTFRAEHNLVAVSLEALGVETIVKVRQQRGEVGQGRGGGGDQGIRRPRGQGGGLECRPKAARHMQERCSKRRL
jgi:exoribonuclease-2